MRFRFRFDQRPFCVVSDSPEWGAVRCATLAHPAIAVFVPEGAQAAAERFLAQQTETSVTSELSAAGGAGFSTSFHADLLTLPPTWLEAQLLAAVSEDLMWAASGLAPPAARIGPATEVFVPGGAPVPGLLRLPRPERRDLPPVVGRIVPHITAPEHLAGDDLRPALVSDEPRSGPYSLRHDVPSGSVIRKQLVSVRDVLARLPVVRGPRTALFLLPFLAVGGAERLLFELLEGLHERYRVLVATLEPHRAELGQTVDEARRLTPYVYTLGDWLPREAHGDVLDHLVRRYEVETLVSWNGTALFYESAPALKRRLPGLRLVNQLYNHEGGWIEHYGPRLVESVDLHLAVNRPIGRALRDERGVPEERLAVIHHAVRIPDEVTADARAERRLRARQDLELPPEALIAGSFMRLHPQKRPFDILRLARLLKERGAEGQVHFLLVGGGPLEAEIDRELETRSLANLTRLPLTRDVGRLFDAVDLCLLPSAFEGLPVFLLEGMARSIPCVATAVGDIPFLLRDGGGVAVERVGDLEALADAVLTFHDAGRRDAEGRRGRETVVRRFSLERYAQAYEQALFPGRANG